MKVSIHRGTHEIGGNCIELRSSGKTILLDFGMPLTATNQDEITLPDVSGLLDGNNPNFLGIIISHPHQDHYGLLPKAFPQTPVFMGREAHAILEASAPFSLSGIHLENVTHYRDRVSFEVGPFLITPYLNDHSAYDAYSLLVESCGKTLFYTGDFRAHGRKTGTFKQLLSQGPKNVDVLLMEGTNIGRKVKHGKPVTENDLEKNVQASMENTKGLALAWFSGQNIDRFVTFYRAAIRAGRTMVVDLYVAQILDALQRTTIPSPLRSDLRVYLPARMKMHIVRNRYFRLVSPYYEHRIYAEELKENASNLVMNFRPVMCNDLVIAECLNGARLIYSMWPGYLGKGDYDIRDWCKEYSVDFEIRHTSGHADISSMKELVDAISPNRIIPIHSFQPELFSDFFQNVEQMNDGEWFEA